MPVQKIAPDEIPEIVGSNDLRKMFADKGEVKGSFFINNIEFHQFRANSIENLLAQINAKENEAFVSASIDDGYHLVLEAHSPAPILVRAGAPYVETPPVGGEAAAAVKAAIDATHANQRDDRERDLRKNTILEDLGLEATHDTEDQPIPGAIGPGLNEEERRKRRYERAARSGAIRGMPATNPSGSGSRAVPQSGSRDDNRRFNPVTPADHTSWMEDGSKDKNNPTVQVAPSSNSDRQPTMDDLRNPY